MPFFRLREMQKLRRQQMKPNSLQSKGPSGGWEDFCFRRRRDHENMSGHCRFFGWEVKQGNLLFQRNVVGMGFRNFMPGETFWETSLF